MVTFEKVLQKYKFIRTMDVQIAESWKNLLQAEFKKPYFKQLLTFVEGEYSKEVCYPPKPQLFSAFEMCAFNNLKVVIIGQDPYHGAGQANGLCFSVCDGLAHPPSLKNIFKEIESDLGKPYPASGNLEKWAQQGVLLLNATLTVRENEAGSHQNKGWEIFTNAVIATISEQRQDVVFLLWGGMAKKKGAKIDLKKHVVFTSGHPSPLSANRGYWFGNKHFSLVNNFLINKNISPIEW